MLSNNITDLWVAKRVNLELGLPYELPRRPPDRREVDTMFDLHNACYLDMALLRLVTYKYQFLDEDRCV